MCNVLFGVYTLNIKLVSYIASTVQAFIVNHVVSVVYFYLVSSLAFLCYDVLSCCILFTMNCVLVTRASSCTFCHDYESRYILSTVCLCYSCSFCIRVCCPRITSRVACCTLVPCSKLLACDIRVACQVGLFFTLVSVDWLQSLDDCPTPLFHRSFNNCSPVPSRSFAITHFPPLVYFLAYLLSHLIACHGSLCSLDFLSHSLPPFQSFFFLSTHSHISDSVTFLFSLFPSAVNKWHVTVVRFWFPSVLYSLLFLTVFIFIKFSLNFLLLADFLPFVPYFCLNLHFNM